MKQITRYAIVLLLLLSIIFLARNNTVGASGPMRDANQSALANVKGFVWNDADRDGVQDGKESGIPSVTVNLYDVSGKLVNTAITDATGRYQFDKLTPGDYYLDVVPPAGFAISPKDQGKNEGRDSDTDTITGETILTTLVAGENTLKWDAGLYTSGLLPPQSNPGTVKPPPAEVTACENGPYSVGGVSRLTINNLAPGYCLAAFLRSHAFALGRIPDGAGKVLAPITFVRVFYHGRFMYELPAEDGEVQICYWAPADKEVQIYFFDFYGPRSGERSGQPSWEPLETTVENGMACAAAPKSGAYALIGK